MVSASNQYMETSRSARMMISALVLAMARVPAPLRHLSVCIACDECFEASAPACPSCKSTECLPVSEVIAGRVLNITNPN